MQEFTHAHMPDSIGSAPKQLPTARCFARENIASAPSNVTSKQSNTCKLIARRQFDRVATLRQRVAANCTVYALLRLLPMRIVGAVSKSGHFTSVRAFACQRPTAYTLDTPKTARPLPVIAHST